VRSSLIKLGFDAAHMKVQELTQAHMADRLPEQPLGVADLPSRHRLARKVPHPDIRQIVL